MIHVDIVTVVHNDTNVQLAKRLHDQILAVEPIGWRFITVDNTVDNRGFAKGCNWGAFHPEADAPFIGFLNPDTEVDGPFIEKMRAIFRRPQVVITGNRFAKPQHELQIWGLKDWVCGAAMFVRREWFTEVGGFDESYVWAWEETDLERQAEAQGLKVASHEFPFRHQSPEKDSEEDAEYKAFHFEQGRRVFNRKWANAAPVRSRRRSGGYAK